MRQGGGGGLHKKIRGSLKMIGNLTEEKESLWDNVQRNMWMCFIVVSG